MKTIALCFSTPGMELGEWKMRDYGKRFPGAGWMRHLNMLALKNNFQVIDGKNCIALGFNPKDVVIVQEESNANGILLQKMGADARVITCLESPIFTPLFYDTPNDAAFKHRLYFNGGTEHLYFPSFDFEDIQHPVPWSERKLLCMVTANKHYSSIQPLFGAIKAFNEALKTQLHDLRYNSISHFKSAGLLDLYGRGWPEEVGTECKDKLATIRNYKFALCFENGAYPGYITEKIIDCLVAGVIPVYIGAPDIREHVLPGSMIDGRSFSSLEDMETKLHEMSTDSAISHSPEFGQQWLMKDMGSKYSNEHFAQRILEMCERNKEI